MWSVITGHQPFKQDLTVLYTGFLIMLWLLIAHEFRSMLVRTDSHRKRNQHTSCILCTVSSYSPFLCFITYEATSLASFKVAFFYNGEITIFFTLFVRTFLHGMSMNCMHFIVISCFCLCLHTVMLTLFDCTVAHIVRQSNTKKWTSEISGGQHLFILKQSLHCKDNVTWVCDV